MRRAAADAAKPKAVAKPEAVESLPARLAGARSLGRALALEHIGRDEDLREAGPRLAELEREVERLRIGLVRMVEEQKA